MRGPTPKPTQLHVLQRTYGEERAVAKPGGRAPAGGQQGADPLAGRDLGRVGPTLEVRLFETAGFDV